MRDQVFVDTGHKSNAKKLDSFFGLVSDQDEEYLVDYIDGGNNGSS